MIMKHLIKSICCVWVAAYAAASKGIEVDPEILSGGTWKVQDEVENGTAFPIFENYFLTAGHVVEDKGELHDFTLQNLMSTDPSKQYRGITGKVLYIGCDNYNNRGICPKGDDIALIEANLAENEDIIRFDVSFEARFRYPFRGSSVGYPVDSELSVFSEGQYSIQNIKDNPDVGGSFQDKQLYYLGNSSSATGESGGPVFLRNSNHKIVSLISLNTANFRRSPTTFAVNNMVVVRAVSKIPTPDYLKGEYQSWLNGEPLGEIKDRLGKYSNIELYLLTQYALDRLDIVDTKKPSQGYLRSLFDLLIKNNVDYLVLQLKEYINLEDSSDLNRDIGKVASRLADYYILTGDQSYAESLYSLAVDYMTIFIKNKAQLITSNNAVLNDVVDQMAIAYGGLGMDNKRLSWIAYGAYKGLPSQMEQMAKMAYWNNEYKDAVLYYQAAYETYNKNSNYVPDYVTTGLQLSLEKNDNLPVIDDKVSPPLYKPQTLQLKLEGLLNNLPDAQGINKMLGY